MSNQRGLEDLFKKHLFSCGFKYSYKYLDQKGVKSRVTTYIDMEDMIGNKKTILGSAGSNTSKMKIPFLIPYNKKIIIQDRN